MFTLGLFRNEETEKLDVHLILFFLNALFVIVTYWFANVVGEITSIKLLRTAVIILSIILLLRDKRTASSQLHNTSAIVGIFVLLNVITLPFSSDLARSIGRFLTFIPFLFYLNIFSHYLIQHYSKEEVMLRLMKIFRIVYLFPVINYFTYNPNFNSTNIYGDESMGFTSNNYGWSSAFFLLTNIDVIINDTLAKRKERIVWLVLCIPALYLLLISGSRSGYLSISLAIGIYILFNKSIGVIFKTVLMLGIVFLFVQIQSNEDFALNSRIKKTEETEKEARVVIAETALSVIEHDDFILLFGVGFDNFVAGINGYISSDLELMAHNSYLQILLESGIFVFVYFFIFFFLNAIFKYLKYHIRHYIYIFPLLVIPFFESNYGAGQFLFFPWMGMMILYINFESYPEERPFELNEALIK